MTEFESVMRADHELCRHDLEFSPFSSYGFFGRRLSSDCPVFKIILTEAATNTSVAVQPAFPVCAGSDWGGGNSL